MKQFNLEEYLKDPSQKVITRDGRSVRIICADRTHSIYPICALVNEGEGEEESLCPYTKDGKEYTHKTSCYDLFFVDEVPDFKPYDRVLTRGHDGLPWKANLFSNFKKMGGSTVAVCLKGDYLLSDIIPFDENKVGKIGEI